MPESLETVLGAWDGLAVVTRRDAATGAWIFIALHDDTLGPSMGGTRMKVYPNPADGLRDAMRLAEGMTHKWAAAGFEMGGGKAVIDLERPLHGEERDALFRRYGRLIASLRGTFSTGPDLGTTPHDMATIASQTRYVHGIEGGHAIDPGPYTARGVYASLRAVLRQVFGNDDLEGRNVLIEGLGSVGAPLVRRIAEAGGELLLADLDGDRAQAFADEVGGRRISAAEVIGTECDVYAPCAVGGTLNAETVPRLACKAVCGSANNQLGRPEDADLLHDRGILYAPDYVTNSGGAIAFAMMGRKAPESEIFQRLDGLRDVIEEILTEAVREDRSPLWAASGGTDARAGRVGEGHPARA